MPQSSAVHWPGKIGSNVTSMAERICGVTPLFLQGFNVQCGETTGLPILDLLREAFPKHTQCQIQSRT